MEEFKRQVQNHFAVALSWDEVRALKTIYGDPDSGTIDFMKFAAALRESPPHGLDKARGTYNFLPKTNTEHDLASIEKKIIRKLEDRCKVAGNYQYQWARRVLCDSTSTTVGGLDRGQLKQRLSGLLGVELSDREINVLFDRHANTGTGLVNMQSFATRLLTLERNKGWFMLDNQFREPVVTDRISPSARYRCRPGVETYNPMDNVFPTSLKGFKWNIQRLVSKLKVKLNEQVQGIAGYQFLAGCNLFRHEAPNRKSDRLSTQDFCRVVEYKFGMKLDQDEVLALFHNLVPGTGDSIEIADMVRALVCDDYTDSWFSTRESTDMVGFTKAAPDEVVLQAKKISAGGSWNLKRIEEKIQQKIHERVGGKGVFEVQAAYALFLDGRNTGLSKKSFKAQMHDKFAVVLSNKDVDSVFTKYDPKGTGSLNVHNFVLQLMSAERRPDLWFYDRPTYGFYVLNHAPMKKDPMKAEGWRSAKWTYQQFETAFRDKLLAKSSQDGGSFAYKSAIQLLRSANPDHLDSSNFDRKAFKFAVFRRFDIVMDEHLLDGVFERLDPEGTGKVPVHRLVQRLLPPRQNGSHHLVPKTEEQRQATRALLGKIFGMTGKRREMINVTGSGVEDPQTRSLLERVPTGAKCGADGINSSLANDAEMDEFLLSTAKMTQLVRNGFTSAAAKGQGKTTSTETTSNEDFQSATSSRCGKAENETGCRRQDREPGGNSNQQVPREVLVRFEVGEGGSPSSRTRQIREKGAEMLREKIVDRSGSPERSAGDRHAPRATQARSESAPTRSQEQIQDQTLRLHNSGLTGCKIVQNCPQSARRSSRTQSEGKMASSARCRVLGAARRKQADWRWLGTEGESNRSQTPEYKRPQAGLASLEEETPTSLEKPPGIPRTPLKDRQLVCETRRTEIANHHQLGEDEQECTTAKCYQECRGRKSSEVWASSETAGDQIPTRTLSTEVAGGMPTYARTRPRSASASKREGLSIDRVFGSKPPRNDHGGDGVEAADSRGIGTREGRRESQARASAHRPVRPSSADDAVVDSAERCYQKKLETVYAVQMRAMQRLHRRKNATPTPERPVSGGCQGIGVGHFQSRHSGLDRFALLRGMNEDRDRSVPTGASRFGGGVPYFGP